jgi:hypothetical protein
LSHQHLLPSTPWALGPSPDQRYSRRVAALATRSSSWTFPVPSSTSTTDIAVLHYQTPGQHHSSGIHQTRPPLDNCAELPRPLRRTAAGANLRSCFGFTFFISECRVCRIHAHTKLMPTADTTWQHLAKSSQCKAAWVYVPLSPRDELKAFGIRTQVDRYQGGQKWSAYCVSRCCRGRISKQTNTKHSVSHITPR